MLKQTRHKDKILNCNPSRKTETDWQIEHSLEAGILTKDAPIPNIKDLREAWWKIGNQESTGTLRGMGHS